MGNASPREAGASGFTGVGIAVPQQPRDGISSPQLPGKVKKNISDRKLIIDDGSTVATASDSWGGSRSSMDTTTDHSPPSISSPTPSTRQSSFQGRSGIDDVPGLSDQTNTQHQQPQQQQPQQQPLKITQDGTKPTVAVGATREPFDFNLTEGQSRRAGMADCELECSEITNFLFVGGASIAASWSVLQERGITRVVNCSASVVSNYFIDNPKMTYLSLSMVDGRQDDISWFVAEVIHFIFNGKRAGEKTLVHCEKGVSRSCSFVIAYYMWSTNASWQQAFDYVKSKRQVCSPNTAFTCNLIEIGELLKGDVSSNSILLRCSSHLPHDPNTAVLKMCRRPDSRKLITPSTKELDPRGCFVIRPPEGQGKSKIFIWQGSQASDETAKVALKLAKHMTSVFTRAQDFVIVRSGTEAHVPGFYDAVLQEGPFVGQPLVPYDDLYKCETPTPILKLTTTASPSPPSENLDRPTSASSRPRPSVPAITNMADVAIPPINLAAVEGGTQESSPPKGTASPPSNRPVSRGRSISVSNTNKVLFNDEAPSGSASPESLTRQQQQQPTGLMPIKPTAPKPSTPGSNTNGGGGRGGRLLMSNLSNSPSNPGLQTSGSIGTGSNSPSATSESNSNSIANNNGSPSSSPIISRQNPNTLGRSPSEGEMLPPLSHTGSRGRLPSLSRDQQTSSRGSLLLTNENNQKQQQQTNSTATASGIAFNSSVLGTPPPNHNNNNHTGSSSRLSIMATPPPLQMTLSRPSSNTVLPEPHAIDLVRGPTPVEDLAPPPGSRRGEPDVTFQTPTTTLPRHHKPQLFQAVKIDPDDDDRRKRPRSDERRMGVRGGGGDGDEDDEEFDYQWESMGVYDDEDLIESSLMLLTGTKEQPHFLWVGKDFEELDADSETDQVLQWTARKVARGEVSLAVYEEAMQKPDVMIVVKSGEESDEFWNVFSEGQ